MSRVRTAAVALTVALGSVIVAARTGGRRAARPQVVVRGVRRRLRAVVAVAAVTLGLMIVTIGPAAAGTLGRNWG